jgi:hypothetical protein
MARYGTCPRRGCASRGASNGAGRVSEGTETGSGRLSATETGYE